MGQVSIRPPARILLLTTLQSSRWARQRSCARLESTIKPLQRRSTDVSLLTSKHTCVQTDQTRFSSLRNLRTSKPCKMLIAVNFGHHLGHRKKIRNKLFKKCTTGRNFFESTMRRDTLPSSIRTRLKAALTLQSQTHRPSPLCWCLRKIPIFSWDPTLKKNRTLQHHYKQW